MNTEQVEALTTVLVGHQRIPTFNGHYANRCSGCDHMHGESDGPNSPRHVAHQVAILLASEAFRALVAEERAAALREAADEHEAQLVCCDVFERLRDKPSREWSDAERQEMRSHAICYWSAACAEGDRERADRMTP